MKVRRKSDSAVLEQLLDKGSIESAGENSASRGARSNLAERGGVQQALPGEGRIDIARAAYINREMSPEVMAAERLAKVEQLKALVASGSYFSSRSGIDIAKAVSSGLDEEVGLLKGMVENE